MSKNYSIFSQERKLAIRYSPVKKVIAICDGRKKTFSLRQPKKITSVINDWKKGKSSELIVRTSNTSELLEIVKSAYDKRISASGGLVKNRSGKLLMILKNGKYDLPKGKMEKGEDTEDGALREVMEETGLKRVRIEREFLRTYHAYKLKGKRVFKETVWYLMKTPDTRTRPQTEEGITAVEWISKRDAKRVSGHTYENILLLVWKYFKYPSRQVRRNMPRGMENK